MGGGGGDTSFHVRGCESGGARVWGRRDVPLDEQLEALVGLGLRWSPLHESRRDLTVNGWAGDGALKWRRRTAMR